jgi:cell division septation protein DedD
VGAYFIGFIQGRGVGYEEGRAPSAVEVAKLAVDDAVPGAGVAGDADVLERLNTQPSPLPPADTSVTAKKLLKVQEESVAAQVAQNIKSAEENARLLEEVKPEVKTAPVLSTAAPIPIDLSAEADLFENSENAVEESNAPSNVRMLGTDPLAEDTSKREKDKTLGAILDERVETVRGVTTKGELLGSDVVPLPRGEVARDSLPPTPIPTVVVTALPTLPPREPTVAPKVPTATPTKKPETKSSNEVVVKKVLPSGFFAQVAAPTKLADAESVARKLRQSGFPVIVEQADVNGAAYYRVLVGPEENKVQADRLLGQLRSERYLTSVPFIRRVK